jgi:predicted nucleotidyltransferase
MRSSRASSITSRSDHLASGKPAQIMIDDKRKKELEDLKRRLRRLLGSQAFKMVLFGSRAREDYGEDSDVDMAIRVRGLTREMKRRILGKVAEIELEHLLPISLLVFSEDEFEHLKKRERRIAIDIEREGIPL